MTQEIVLKKVSGIGTVAHESMHVAAFIYYLIKDYPYNSTEALNEVLEETLRSVTIIADEDYAGCFRHRRWDGFTDKANIYCSFAGFIGGYVFTGTGDKDLDNFKSNVNLLKWMLEEYIDPEKLENQYKIWGASEDLKNTGVDDYEKRLRYVKEIVGLLDNSKVFQDMFVDCMKQLMTKYVLNNKELVELAQKYRDLIICETFSQRRVCVSLTDRGPKYYYYL